MMSAGGGVDVMRFANSKRPPSVICPVCSRPYGTASIGIHVKVCQKRFEDEEAKKPPSQRKKLPQIGDLSEQALKGMSGDAVQRMNDQVAKQWNEAVLEKCGNCGRTFLPDRLMVHQRSCTTASPARAVNDSVRRGAPGGGATTYGAHVAMAGSPSAHGPGHRDGHGYGGHEGYTGLDEGNGHNPFDRGQGQGNNTSNFSNTQGHGYGVNQSGVSLQQAAAARRPSGSSAGGSRPRSSSRPRTGGGGSGTASVTGSIPGTAPGSSRSSVAGGVPAGRPSTSGSTAGRAPGQQSAGPVAASILAPTTGAGQGMGQGRPLPSLASSRASTHARLAALLSRVEAMHEAFETEIGSIEGQIATLQGTIAAATTQVNGLKGQAEELRAGFGSEMAAVHDEVEAVLGQLEDEGALADDNPGADGYGGQGNGGGADPKTGRGAVWGPYDAYEAKDRS